MSEYTRYFAVRSTSVEDAKDRLEDARMLSVIEPGDEGSDWIVVAAPAGSGTSDSGEFVYRDQFARMAELFDNLLFFFQDEVGPRWTLKVRYQGREFARDFRDGEELELTDEEILILTDCFGKDVEEFRDCLVSGQSFEFCQRVGIPYLELLDQDQIPEGLSNGGQYAFLSDEMD